MKLEWATQKDPESKENPNKKINKEDMSSPQILSVYSCVARYTSIFAYEEFPFKNTKILILVYDYTK